MKLDVRDRAAGALLNPHALGDLAGARVEFLDFDTVLLLERIDHDLPVRRAELGVIDRYVCFRLGGCDDFVPVLGAGRRERRAASIKATTGPNFTESLPWRDVVSDYDPDTGRVQETPCHSWRSAE